MRDCISKAVKAIALKFTEEGLPNRIEEFGGVEAVYVPSFLDEIGTVNVFFLAKEDSVSMTVVLPPSSIKRGRLLKVVNQINKNWPFIKLYIEDDESMVVRYDFLEVNSSYLGETAKKVYRKTMTFLSETWEILYNDIEEETIKYLIEEYEEEMSQTYEKKKKYS